MYFLQLAVQLIIWFLSHCNCKVRSNYIFQCFFLHLLLILFKVLQDLVYKFTVFRWKKYVLYFEFFIFLANFLENGFIYWILLNLIAFDLLLLLNVPLLLSLVEQHIGIFYLFLCFVPSVLPTKCFLGQIIDIEIFNQSIIELIPFGCVSVLDEGIVVSAVSIAKMDYNSFQDIAVVIIGLFLLIIDDLLVLLFS